MILARQLCVVYMFKMVSVKVIKMAVIEKIQTIVGRRRTLHIRIWNALEKGDLSISATFDESLLPDLRLSWVRTTNASKREDLVRFFFFIPGEERPPPVM